MGRRCTCHAARNVLDTNYCTNILRRLWNTLYHVPILRAYLRTSSLHTRYQRCTYVHRHVCRQRRVKPLPRSSGCCTYRRHNSRRQSTLFSAPLPSSFPFPFPFPTLLRSVYFLLSFKWSFVRPDSFFATVARLWNLLMEFIRRFCPNDPRIKYPARPL